MCTRVMTSLPIFMNVGVCEWERRGRNNQRDRAVASCVFLLTSSHPRPLVLHSLTQDQRLRQLPLFLPWALAHVEPF